MNRTVLNRIHLIRPFRQNKRSGPFLLWVFLTAACAPFWRWAQRTAAGGEDISAGVLLVFAAYLIVSFLVLGMFWYFTVGGWEIMFSLRHLREWVEFLVGGAASHRTWQANITLSMRLVGIGLTYLAMPTVVYLDLHLLMAAVLGLASIVVTALVAMIPPFQEAVALRVSMGTKAPWSSTARIAMGMAVVVGLLALLGGAVSEEAFWDNSAALVIIGVALAPFVVLPLAASSTILTLIYGFGKAGFTGLWKFIAEMEDAAELLEVH